MQLMSYMERTERPSFSAAVVGLTLSSASRVLNKH